MILNDTHLVVYRNYDFISIQIDGITDPDFYCSFEGLYYYAFHMAEIMWGLLWLYDLIIMTEKPSLYTGKYLMYYACIAYFTAFGFSIVLYFQNVDNFTSVSITRYDGIGKLGRCEKNLNKKLLFQGVVS